MSNFTEDIDKFFSYNQAGSWLDSGYPCKNEDSFNYGPQSTDQSIFASMHIE